MSADRGDTPGTPAALAQVAELLAQSVALQARLATLLEALPGRIAAELQQPRASIKPADRAALAEVLPAIFEATRQGNSDTGSAWLLRDLEAEEPAAHALLLRVTGGKGTDPAKAAGKFLSRVVGVVIDGLRIERVGDQAMREGTLWMVRRVS